MPASSPSVVDLLGSVSTAAGAAITLGAIRLDSAPGFRSFAGAWAAITVHLLSRPGSSAGHPGFMITDALTGAAAGALLLHGASAWEADHRRRDFGSAFAFAFFALSCAVQSTLTMTGGPQSPEMTLFRTSRLVVVTALAFHFTRAAREGDSASPWC
jgi:hypothetical protein